MKQLTAISLALITLFVGATSGDHSPRLYFNRFHKELNNFQLRSMEFYIVNLTDADDKIISHHLEKTITQLKQGRKRVESAPVYKGDPTFRNNYLIGIDSLLFIFETDFAKVQNLKKYRNQSYQQLLDYYEALGKTEKKVRAKEKYLADIEQHFAAKYNLRLDTKTKSDLEYQAFVHANDHYRSLSLQFSKVDHNVEDYLKTIKSHPNKNLTDLGLSIQLENINISIKEALSAVSKLNEGKLNPSLKNDLIAYLKQLKKQSKHELEPITQSLEAEQYYSNEFRDSKTDLQFFVEAYHSDRSKFLDAQQLWISSTLEKL